MNYSEHDKFPNHDAVKCPCIVRVESEDKYFHFTIDKKNNTPQSEVIPNELGEWAGIIIQAIKGIKEVAVLKDFTSPRYDDLYFELDSFLGRKDARDYLD